jgi:hypothetical protein
LKQEPRENVYFYFDNEVQYVLRYRYIQALQDTACLPLSFLQRLVAGGWWLVAGGWWLAAFGWRLAAVTGSVQELVCLYLLFWPTCV